MAGLVPAIHVLLCYDAKKDVDARHKAGHDGLEHLLGNDKPYGFKIEAPVVARASSSVCALAASFSA